MMMMVTSCSVWINSCCCSVQITWYIDTLITLSKWLEYTLQSLIQINVMSIWKSNLVPNRWTWPKYQVPTFTDTRRRKKQLISCEEGEYFPNNWIRQLIKWWCLLLLVQLLLRMLRIVWLGQTGWIVMKGTCWYNPVFRKKNEEMDKSEERRERRNEEKEEEKSKERRVEKMFAYRSSPVCEVCYIFQSLRIDRWFR